MFDKAKELYALQKQAKVIKAKLQAMSFTAEGPGGNIVITVNGEQDVTDVAITLTDAYVQDPNMLASHLLDTVNRAIEKSKKGAAESMKGMMGGLGIPGMGS